MKKKRHQEEQNIRILREAERGNKSIGEICREQRITEPTFYRWRKKFGGMEIAGAVGEWIRRNGSQAYFFEPGSPWQKGYAESFHRKLRDKCLNMVLSGVALSSQLTKEMLP